MKKKYDKETTTIMIEIDNETNNLLKDLVKEIKKFDVRTSKSLVSRVLLQDKIKEEHDKTIK